MASTGLSSKDFLSVLNLDGTELLLRPIRPEDEPLEVDLARRASRESLYFRFFGFVPGLDHKDFARFTHIDYDREMAFVATVASGVDGFEILGVVRLVSDRFSNEDEFAIIVRSDIKGRGLGRILLEKIIRYARGRDRAAIVGQVLPDNDRMLSLARELGFAERLVADGAVVEVRMSLASARAAESL